MSSFVSSNIQEQWNKNRLNLLYKILGMEWFKDKLILEVACGHGNIGKELIEKGSKVIFTDGRKEHVDSLIEDGLEAYVMDQDSLWKTDWLNGRKVDLIIHWGVLYHLFNWQQDLWCATKLSPLVCMETEIVEGNISVLVEEKEWFDQALNKETIKVSEIELENFFYTLDKKFQRYDDPDLNVGNHIYSWQPQGNIHKYIIGQRRFYMIGEY